MTCPNQVGQYSRGLGRDQLFRGGVTVVRTRAFTSPGERKAFIELGSRYRKDALTLAAHKGG